MALLLRLPTASSSPAAVSPCNVRDGAGCYKTRRGRAARKGGEGRESRRRPMTTLCDGRSWRRPMTLSRLRCGVALRRVDDAAAVQPSAVADPAEPSAVAELVAEAEAPVAAEPVAEILPVAR